MEQQPLLPQEPIVNPAMLRPPALTLDQAMAHAGTLQAQGRLQQSEALLKQILQKRPDHPPALHLLGVIAHQAGKTDLAVELVKHAISRDSEVALFHSNLGEMYRQSGCLDEAVTHGEKAVELAPGIASTHSNLGVAYYDCKQFDKAEASQRRALELDAGMSRALNNLGSIMREKEQPKEAITCYRRACTADPKYLEPLNNLGSVLITEERYDESVQVLAKALSMNPRYADAHCNIGFALKGKDQNDQALKHFQNALKLRPSYPEAYLGLGNIHQQQQRHDLAMHAYRKTIELAPDNANAFTALASLYTELEEDVLAVEQFEKALELEPTMSAALLGLGNIRMELGDMEGAEGYFQKALDCAKPDDPGPRFYLTQLRKVQKDSEQLQALLKMNETIGEMSEQKQITINYALGKSFDDLGEKERAIQHFLAGAELKRKKINFDPNAQEKTFDEVLAALDEQAIKKLKGGGNDSELPIFVLGMPRSGTTLTEQIIASHPDVHGAGELRNLFNLAYRPLKADDKDVLFPFNLQHLGPDVIGQWAEEYVQQLQARAPDAARITDKMPGNYLLTGLIHLMLPKAKIIHVRRNPVDTCLSCFTRLFQHGQEHTYDLVELGRYYRGYLKVMEHWRKVLPKGAFYEVHYEDLVANTEAEAKKLLNYCGLKWDDTCLDFHNNKRKVRTASVTQVRQPIYSTSVDRWLPYKDALAPLLETLGDVVDAP